MDTLRINRSAFSTFLGIPATLPDGSRNPELDSAITDLVPLDLKSGRGAYEGGYIYTLDLRVGYRFREFRGIAAELYVDLFNATDVQHVNDYTTSLSTDVAVTTANIGDRSIYRFGRPLTYQSPRSVAPGFRASF